VGLKVQKERKTKKEEERERFSVQKEKKAHWKKTVGGGLRKAEVQ